MSRSRRHKPIWGICIASSERWCKKTWHRRFRTRERQALASASPEVLEAHQTVLEREVSNVSAMQKDGHSYHPLKEQVSSAEWSAEREGQTPEERASIKNRLLHKWMGK